MIRLDRPVIVEGKYDRITLSRFVDAPIIATEGFHLLGDDGLRQTVKTLAHGGGIIILTDSDAAGFRIRKALGDMAAGGDVIHVYIPDVFGKERRKAEPSREGKLGVEGMSEAVILEAFRRAGVFGADREPGEAPVTTAELYRDGLTGKADSAGKRRRVLARLGLPARLSVRQLLALVNTSVGRAQYESAVRAEKGENPDD